MAKLIQNEQGKMEFQSEVLNFFKEHPNVTYTREELCSIFGMNDSSLRREVADIAHYYPVLSLSGKKGYVFLQWEGTQPVEQLKKVREYIVQQIAEDQSRVDAINCRMKPLIANLRVLDRIIEDKQKE